MTSYVSAQVLSQNSWLSCLSSVSHSQPLDYVWSCSETRRIWIGKYSHVWQYIPSLSFFCLPPPDVYLLLLSFSLLSPSFLPAFSFSVLLLPLEVSHHFSKRKATFSKDDAVVSKPPLEWKTHVPLPSTGQKEIGQLAHFFPCWRWREMHTCSHKRAHTLLTCTYTTNVSQK